MIYNFVVLNLIFFYKKETRAILYGFWASSCTWRVRAALHFKGIAFEEKSVDIVTKQKQLTDEYRYINPSQKVPALVMSKNN